jgi:hypothetical protein
LELVALRDVLVQKAQYSVYTKTNKQSVSRRYIQVIRHSSKLFTRLGHGQLWDAGRECGVHIERLATSDWVRANHRVLRVHWWSADVESLRRSRLSLKLLTYKANIPVNFSVQATCISRYATHHNSYLAAVDGSKSFEERLHWRRQALVGFVARRPQGVAAHGWVRQQFEARIRWRLHVMHIHAGSDS